MARSPLSRLLLAFAALLAAASPALADTLIDNVNGYTMREDGRLFRFTGRFAGAQIGEQVKFGGDVWTVVGIFETNGDAHESSLMTDAETLNSADQRGFQSVTVFLESPAAFQTFKDSLSANPTLASRAALATRGSASRNRSRNCGASGSTPAGSTGARSRR